MKFTETSLPGVYVITPEPIRDARGSFSRVFCATQFRSAGLVDRFVQVNHAKTEVAGTIRGLHYQLPPDAEVKLLRCTRGEVFDVVVDVRRGSKTFLQWHGEQLNDRDGKMIYVPPGFAHGYQALTDGAEVTYQSSVNYAPASERRIRFDDPRVGIVWMDARCSVSPKDADSARLPDDFEGIELS